MNERPDHSGAACWVDLGVPDPERAAAFYGTLFGWTYTPADDDHYRVARLQGRAASGLGLAENPGLPYWTVIVGTSDIDATSRAFDAAGATTIEAPSPASTVGRSAIFADPLGAHVSLWQPGTVGGMETVGEHGSFALAELVTSHPGESAAFYEKALGWRREADRLLRGATVAAYLSQATSATHQDPRSSWLVHFASDDVEHTAAHAIRLGATLVDLPSRSDVVLQDPQGALFGVTSTK